MVSQLEPFLGDGDEEEEEAAARWMVLAENMRRPWVWATEETMARRAIEAAAEEARTDENMIWNVNGLGRERIDDDFQERASKF